MAASVWRGRLAFGMVSIPVRLYKAARRERIRFRHVYRPAELGESERDTTGDEAPEIPMARGKVHELPKRAPLPDEPAPEAVPDDTVARVRNLPVREEDDAPIESPRILKGFEIEKDRFVTLDPAEVAAMRPRTSTELEIAEFVKLEEIDPVFFDSSYYAVPDGGGEKPYALLFRALTETEYAAVGSLAMHGREHATVIRPGAHGLILHTLFYANEVRAEEEFRTDAELVGAKELELAKTLVRALAAPFEPSKLKDTFEERLRELIEARAESAVSSYRQGEPAVNRPPAADILEALRKSLELARKPAASEKAPAKKQRKTKA